MQRGIEWLDHRIRDGVVERSFRIIQVHHVVPGALWLPLASASPPPLILLGHGGSSDKRSRRNVDLAHWFASHAGFAAVAIDGPYHGDRAIAGQEADWHARMAKEGIHVVLDRMTQDWQVTVHALAICGIVDAGRLSYLGTSMGTRFGIPLIAAMGDQFRCAVLGKFGLRQALPAPPELAASERVVSDCRRITIPVLFHIQWHDELFSRDSQFAIFDALGSKDKELAGYTGGHGDTKPQAIIRWQNFVVQHLSKHVGSSG